MRPARTPCVLYRLATWYPVVMTEDFEFGSEGFGSVARVYRARDARATLVLAHGAGSTQDHPFMVALAERLAAARLETVTFDFLYARRKRRAPDPNGVLESTWRAAAQAVRSRMRGPALLAGGKSMGGRIASQVAAQGGLDPVAGLVLLGYPLHPPGKPQVLRTAHLPKVRCPMLFVQGSRDTFGTPTELRPVVEALPAQARLFVVEGGDHSLSPRKKGAAMPDVMARVVAEIDAFVGEVTA
jgi:predicted alpha/beta-hydrolase family hydrolase